MKNVLLRKGESEDKIILDYKKDFFEVIQQSCKKLRIKEGYNKLKDTPYELFNYFNIIKIKHEFQHNFPIYLKGINKFA